VLLKEALLKSGMTGSFAPSHPALFSSQESAMPLKDLVILLMEKVKS
jgi:hypothetical protein